MFGSLIGKSKYVVGVSLSIYGHLLSQPCDGLVPVHGVSLYHQDKVS